MSARAYFGPQWATWICMTCRCLIRRLALLWASGSGLAETEADFISERRQKALHVSRGSFWTSWLLLPHRKARGCSPACCSHTALCQLDQLQSWGQRQVPAFLLTAELCSSQQGIPPAQSCQLLPTSCILCQRPGTFASDSLGPQVSLAEAWGPSPQGLSPWSCLWARRGTFQLSLTSPWCSRTCVRVDFKPFWSSRPALMPLPPHSYFSWNAGQQGEESSVHLFTTNTDKQHREVFLTWNVLAYLTKNHLISPGKQKAVKHHY